MKRKLLGILLIFALLLPPLCFPASASGGNPAARWFSGQLTSQGKAIYNALVKMYESGMMKDGKTSFDLAGSGVPGAADQYPTVTQRDITEYLGGNRTLFNDFAAAKDAFDLEHPEAWYVDSSYLSFRVTKDAAGKRHAYMGPGRSTDYYVAGVSGAQDVDAKSAALEEVLSSIVAGAKAVNPAGLSGTEAAVRRVQYVHDRITNGISYRYEIDCSKGNEGYIRTVYALVTHEGVCESYSRAMQLILGRLGIPCVPVHGMQTSGDPEPHMWNAVRIGGSWYIVDATWDDPVGLDTKGQIVRTSTPGVDGGEHRNYFLVGREKTANWAPSGQVSSGEMIFAYPEISLRSYAGAEAFRSDSGLVVREKNSTMEKGTKATEFQISFQGKGVVEAAKDGYYLLVRQSYLDENGGVTPHFDWYYLVAATAIYEDNPFIFDTADHFTMVDAVSQYMEYAVTTRAPAGFDPNAADPIKSYKTYYADNALKDKTTGFYTGGGSDLLCETGLIYNANGNYKAAPYVKSAYPAMTQQLDAGCTYRARVEFDDVLIHPTQAAVTACESSADPEDKDEAAVLTGLREAAGKTPNARYETFALDINGDITPHVIQGSVVFGNISWIWACGNSGHQHSFETCGVTGLEFDFKASDQWADDSVCYEFCLDGLVGKTSNKRPNTWSWVLSTPSCPVAYRSQGIDWNLWGQPSLLDNPDDLDLDEVIVQGTDGKKRSLAELSDQMNSSGYNGKLTLTVEDISKSRPRSEEISEALEENMGVDPDMISQKLMYEIDFTRICKMVVLETGQSVRVSVGYPAGVTYENLKDYVIKAYHFTRCEEGSCDQEHEHTGEIISVQELQISATPYGLVILCDSFSPFEIVALDADKVSSEDKNIKTRNVIVATDGNGEVKVDGRPAVGADGFVQFDDGANASHTFTVTPKPGYALDTVSYGGDVELHADGNNQFTMTSAQVTDVNDVLSFTFVPESVKRTDALNSETVDIPKVCNHAQIAQDSADRAATCTQDGHISRKVCEICGQVVAEAQDIPASGHDFQGYRTRVQPTCTENGQEYALCVLCDELDIRDIPALGHDFVDGVCSRCGAADPGLLPFSDVAGGQWYFEDVRFASQNGLMNGTGDGNFNPAGVTTRAEVVTILWRLSGSPVVGKAVSFRDVDASAWYAGAVKWAHANGIAEGSDGLFLPDAPVTREQLVTFLLRYAEYRGKDTGGAGLPSGFSDIGSVSDWALDAMEWACANDILKGSDGRLNPASTAMRCELAAVFHRLCDRYDLL